MPELKKNHKILALKNIEINLQYIRTWGYKFSILFNISEGQVWTFWGIEPTTI